MDDELIERGGDFPGEESESAREQQDIQRLEMFGALVQGWIREAVDARDASGIENRWREDLRQYYGEELSTSVVRSLAEQAQQGPQMQSGGEKQSRSRITVNITRPKTNAAIARLSDMLLPTDDKNWGIQPTPSPKLSSDLSDRRPMVDHGQPMLKPDGTPSTVADQASRLMSEAAKRAKLMELEIDDQLTECNYNAEQRKVIWDLGVMGTGIVRGPFAKTRVSRKWRRAGGNWAMTEERDIVPAAVRVSPWRFFPDPACGGEIKNARYVVEEDDFNSKTLRALRGQEGFIDSQIVACLNEGPRSSRRRSRAPESRYIEGEYEFDEKTMYEVFIVHGEFAKGDLLDAIGQTNGGEPHDLSEEERQDAVTGCVFICNGRVIKAYMNPMPDESLPYAVAVYERIEGQVFGVGVPYVLRNPQRVITAAWRMVLDNSALTSGGQIVVNRKLVEPADGSWKITGTKLWWAKDGTEDVNKAFATFQFDSRQSELLQIIDKAMQFSQDESSLPAIMEGSTKDAPQTVGVATTLTNNSNTVLRRLVKTYDDDITDVVITGFYHWNMQHNQNDEIKGDYQVDARGSSVLLVKDLQKQALMQVGTYVLHPALAPLHKRGGYDWLRMTYESNHVTPDSVLIPEDQVEPTLQRMAEQAQQQPQDPRIAAAQIAAQLKQMELTARFEDAERERQFDNMRHEREYELALIKYANENKKTLEEVQASLTQLMLTQRHEERMMDKEAAIKAQFGSGI